MSADICMRNSRDADLFSDSDGEGWTRDELDTPNSPIPYIQEQMSTTVSPSKTQDRSVFTATYASQNHDERVSKNVSIVTNPWR